MTNKQHTVQRDWVQALQHSRLPHGYQQPVVRVGTTPVLDLIVLAQLDPLSELWFVYDQPSYSTEFWNAMLLLPQYRSRITVSTAETLVRTMSGGLPSQRPCEDAWVMSIQPDLTATQRCL